jgi:hypothetical protein
MEVLRKMFTEIRLDTRRQNTGQNVCEKKKKSSN